jgi:hypothetical protein
MAPDDKTPGAADESKRTGVSENTEKRSTSDTAALLAEVQQALERFVVFPTEHEAVAVALWVLHTFIFQHYSQTPYLWVHSATKQAGKSVLFELLSFLTHRPWLVVGATEAVLFRRIERNAPTLLFDEIDATFGQNSELTQAIRGILNAGNRKGATVPRCVGNDFKDHDFAVYCPKGFAGIGDGLPDTLQDRSIPIVLRRCGADDRQPALFRFDYVCAEVKPLADSLAAWGETFVESEPVLPAALSDRQRDCWRPLFAIAEMAGPEWLERAEQAALYLHAQQEDSDPHVLLLLHCWEAFEAFGTARLQTSQLLRHLTHRGDSSPWAHWWRYSTDQASAQGLARMLKPFGIAPKTVRFGLETGKGYLREQFEQEWTRYHIGDEEPETPETPEITREVMF